MEVLHTFERCHSKIDKISHVEGDWSSLRVSITLLPGLGCLQTIPNELDLLFGLLNDIRTKDLTFSRFRPIERGMTFASVEGFKRGHLQASLVTIIVGKLREWQTVFPLGSIRQNTSSQHIFKDLVYSFGLTSSLWVVGCAEGQLGA
jgi:hypothetical protein